MPQKYCPVSAPLVKEEVDVALSVSHAYSDLINECTHDTHMLSVLRAPPLRTVQRWNLRMRISDFVD